MRSERGANERAAEERGGERERAKLAGVRFGRVPRQSTTNGSFAAPSRGHLAPFARILCAFTSQSLPESRLIEVFDQTASAPQRLLPLLQSSGRARSLGLNGH